ncbi:MAG: dihydrofolate reductase [Methylophilaceae bacterium]
MPQLSIIVAIAKNGVIGFNNSLPWHLPEDLKRFKALTTGHHIIMGRKTYESLGCLLPNRITVIVTRNKNYTVEGALIAHSLKDAIQLCKNDDEAFIIGGAELYQQALKSVHQLYITEVDLDVPGDTFFPQLNSHEWQETARSQHVSKSGLAFSYVSYERATNSTL